MGNRKDQYLYKRVALIGAIANPNVGDDAVLDMQLNRLERMYGDNYKAYIFSKDASYTIRFTQNKRGEILPVDYLHRISVNAVYAQDIIQEQEKKLLEYTGSSDEENESQFAVLHKIFSEIDVLHILGGGYINSLWMDMALEIHMAVKLAAKYGKKILITGISTMPLQEESKQIVKDILDTADIIDYRDDSYKLADYTTGGKLIQTCDDIIAYYSGKRPRCHMDGKYANITFTEWMDNSELVREKISGEICPFLSGLLADGELDYVNILGFSEGDLRAWKESNIPEGLASHLHFIDLVNQHPYTAKEIVSGAVFNIATRFHHAVFSLSSQVPVFGIYYGQYYENKFQTLYALFKASYVSELGSLTSDALHSFYENRKEYQHQLIEIWENVRLINQKKNYIIAKAYSTSEDETDILTDRLNDIYCKVSVIVPIYNMERYLQQCLDSILSQSLEDIEVICINDGSTDRSQEILFENAWKDRRVRVLSQVNKGVAEARNRGLAAAAGEFVFFVDPDDWLPDKNVLSDLYYAAKNHHAIITGGGFAEHNPEFHRPRTEWEGNLCRYAFDQEGFYTFEDLQFDYGWIRFLYNRYFLTSNEFKFPKRLFYEDPVWFVQVMHEAKVFYGIQRVVYCYRTGYKSFDLSRDKVIDLLKGIGDIIEFSLEHQYSELLDLEKSRLTKDYAVQIGRCMETAKDPVFYEQLDRINRLLYPQNNNRIEREIDAWNRELERESYRRIIEEKQQLIAAREDELNDVKRQLANIYKSATWKIGDLLLYLPKKVLRAIRHEES